MKSVDSYYPRIIAADMYEKYAREEYVVYVLVSSPQTYIVPLGEMFEFDRGQMIIRVHVSELDAFHQWARGMNLVGKDDFKDKEF